MIIKFDDFILEGLILESNVIYSDKFKNVLSKMKDDTIASELLKMENTDIDVSANFIGVKDEDDNILTFTPDRVAQSILKSNDEYIEYNGGVGGWLSNNIQENGDIFNILKYEPKSTEVYRPRISEPGLIIAKTVSKVSGKTWCYVKFENGEGIYNFDKLKPTEKDLNKLNKLIFTKRRQEIRIGRLIRTLLKANNIDITAAQVEKFVNDFRASLAVINDAFSNFELVSGDDLGFWYNRKNYLDPKIGNLGSSCQSVGRLDWLEIYIKNPDTVKLLILKSQDHPDKIIGRVLVWKLDDGNHLMDYIYTSRDSDKKIFLDYAESRGWESIEPNGWGKTYTAHLKPMTFDSYPSVDTMNNWDPSTGEISNKSFFGSRMIIWSEDDEDDGWDDYDEDDED